MNLCILYVILFLESSYIHTCIYMYICIHVEYTQCMFHYETLNQVVPSGTKWYQVVPSGTKWYQVVPSGT
jgi:hypothetical protein